MKNKYKMYHSAITPISLKNVLFSFLFPDNGLINFERRINTLLNINNSYSFTSFMRTIYICLNEIKKKDNRKYVIIPRFSCPTFSHAIIASGLKIQYCDINSHTLSIDYNYLDKINSEGMLALISVNHFGLSNNMDIITQYCKKNNIYLIEDIGYSIGTEYKNKKLGSFGNYAVLNFKEGKGIPIQGGMIATNHGIDLSYYYRRKKNRSNLVRMVGFYLLTNPYIYNIFRKTMTMLRINYRTKFTSEDTYRKFSDEYRYYLKSTDPMDSISDFQGAMGINILEKLDQYMFIRKRNALLLEEGLSQISDLEIIQPEKGVNQIHFIRYPILVKNKKREKVLNKLLNNNIEARDIYSEVKPDPDRFPESYRVSKELLTLPCHPLLTIADIERVVGVIKESLND